MKRLSLLFGFILCLTAVWAQTKYHPITDGCTWSVSDEKFITLGDTVLEGKTYLKLYRQFGNQPFEINIDNIQYFAAIRDDSVERKVYAYLPAGTLIHDIVDFSSSRTDTAMEVLLYDFSLKVGDTLIYYLLGDNVVESAVVRIEAANITVGWNDFSSIEHQYDETDTVVSLSDNTSRSLVFLKDVTYFGQDNVWIEGVGSVRGFDEGSQVFIGDYGNRILLCFADSSGAVLQTGFDSDDDPNDCFCIGFGGDMPVHEELNVKIYPNPITEYMYVSAQQLEDKELHMNIFNTMGICIHRETIKGTDLNKIINLKHLPDGVYIVQIEQSQRQFTYKIIKL